MLGEKCVHQNCAYGSRKQDADMGDHGLEKNAATCGNQAKRAEKSTGGWSFERCKLRMSATNAE